LWGKAQNYLKRACRWTWSPAHFTLAQLNEKIGKPELAKEHYNKGQELV